MDTEGAASLLGLTQPSMVIDPCDVGVDAIIN